MVSENMIPLKNTITAVIFLICSLLVVLNFLSSPDGFISPDSANYLKLSQNISDGNGYFVSNNGIPERKEKLFAIWPAGYPTLIASFSLIPGLNVVWASKILNISLLGVSLIIVRFLFSLNGHLLGASFIFGSYITIYSFTWSEAPFITFLLAYCYFLSKLISNIHAATFFNFFGIVATSIGLFLSRYVGFFSLFGFAFIGLVAIHRKDMPLFGKSALFGIFSFIMMAGYLFINYKVTGHITGIERISARESSMELLQALLFAFSQEIVLPFAHMKPTWHYLIFVIPQIILCALILFVFWANYKHWREKVSATHISLIVTGVVYLMCIIYLRWISAFDMYNFRLLAPGTLLIGLALLDLVMKSSHLSYILAIATLVISVTGSGVIVGYRMLESETGFPSAHAERAEKYMKISEDAVVIFSDIHLLYLRPGLYRASPEGDRYTNNPENQEELSDFLGRIDPEAPIYIQTGPRSRREDRYSDSVESFVRSLPKNQIIRLR